MRPTFEAKIHMTIPSTKELARNGRSTVAAEGERARPHRKHEGACSYALLFGLVAGLLIFYLIVGGGT